MLSVTRLVDLARPERRRDSQPFFSVSPMSVCRSLRPSRQQRGIELAPEGERDAAGHHHVVVAQPFDGERAAASTITSAWRVDQSAPRWPPPAAAQAPEPQASVRPAPRSHTRSRSLSSPTSSRHADIGALGEEAVVLELRSELGRAGSPRHRRRRRWRAGCPCWCRPDPAAARARPACGWCRRPRAPGSRASRAARRPMSTEITGRPLAPLPVFCDLEQAGDRSAP